MQQLKSSERSFEHLLKHGSEMPRDVLVKASERPVAGHFPFTPPVASLQARAFPAIHSPPHSASIRPHRRKVDKFAFTGELLTYSYPGANL
ncbi:hypothetical protein M8494_05890 [Serratia ureilytica]